MAKEYRGSEYIEVVDSTIGIKPEKIIVVEPGPGISIDYPDGKMKISVNLTEEQRLALKGDKGDTGAAGKDGKDGKDGKNGRDGTNGQDGRNGTDGIQGPPGIPGASTWDDIENKPTEFPPGPNSVGKEQLKNPVNLIPDGETTKFHVIMRGDQKFVVVKQWETFTESETPIGTWIDGKTIYRKFVRSSTQVPSMTWTPVYPLDADTIIDIKVWSSYDNPNHPTYLSNCLHGRVENGQLNIWLDDLIVKANDLIMVEYTR